MFFCLRPGLHKIRPSKCKQNVIIQLASPFIFKRNYIVNDQIKEHKKQTTSAVTDKIGPEKSYLEEILLEEEKEAKTTGQKVKRAAETTFYFTFGIASLIALGGLSYYLFKELFSFNSPQGLYKNALKKIKQDERCIEIFGPNMLAYGEESARGRRRYIANQRFQKDGQERLRIIFYLKGCGHIGRVHAELANIDSKWEYRFLIVEIDSSTSKNAIIIIDNR